MKKTIVALRTFIGWVFVFLGVFGLVLPLLQGIFFLIVGLYVLSLDSKWFRIKLEHLSQKNIRVAKLYQKIDRAIRNFFGMPDEIV
jgi:hypothetical protein